MSKTVVLLSGGQDSTTAFYWALMRGDFDDVAAVSFDYQQRHRVELELARKTAEDAGVAYDVIPVNSLSHLGAASLTNPEIGNADERSQRNVYAEERGLPASFVPGRNVLFFALAAAWGAPLGFDSIVTGVCAQDRAGYPDCRYEFVEAMEAALQHALDMPGFQVFAPILHIDKAQTWALADDLGVLENIRRETHTCYEGVRDELHEWGYGCGNCGACVERARGWAEFAADAVAENPVA